MFSALVQFTTPEKMEPVSTEVEESRRVQNESEKQQLGLIKDFTENNVKWWDCWQTIHKINVHWDLHYQWVNQVNKTEKPSRVIFHNSENLMGP